MIILSLPYNKKPTQKGYDLIEYRLDYNPSLNFDFIKDDKNIIYTYRVKAEGGINSISNQNLQKLHANIINNTQALIDVELCTYQKNINFYKTLPPERLILSIHIFNENSINLDNLKSTINNCKLKCKYVKIALTINSYTNFYYFTKLLSQIKIPFIAVAMGKLGYLSRVMYKILGSKATYVNQGFSTATGQISLNTASTLNIKNFNKNTKIGGLLGGKQVYESIGIKFYNQYFVNNSVNYVYLPFVSNSFDDFIFWFKKQNFYGCSVTMPFKKIATKYFKSTLKSINLFLPNNSCYNTDEIAFKKCLDFFKITKKCNILIYGSGGTAIAFAKILYNYKNVFIYARNKQTKAFLQKQFNLKNHNKNNKYCLFVNCTPVQNINNAFLLKNNINAKKIINLTYNKNTKIKAKSNIINGLQFWNWQMQKQLKLFLNNKN